MRQLKLESMKKIVSNTINNFISNGKAVCIPPEYAMIFIDMYSVSFLDNVLLNKLMTKVVRRGCENTFTLFPRKGGEFGLETRGKSFNGKVEARYWSNKRFSVKSISLLSGGMA
jgi:hypothetical protein